MLNKNIAIIIPAYKGEKFLPKLLDSIIDYEISKDQVYLVIDGDYDSSKDIAIKYGVNYHVHNNNRGKGAALSSAFKILPREYEWAISIDVDGQHLISDLENFTTKLNDETVGVIVGSRPRSLKNMPFARFISNTLTSAILSLFIGQKIEDSQCGYRAYSRKLFSRINCRYNRFEMESEILILASKLGFKIESTPISTVYGDEESSISHVVDTLRWIKAVLFTAFIKLEKGKNE